MKELALTNYTAGLNTVLVYLTEIMSQVTQLRLHALVEQKIEVMRERVYYVLKENLMDTVHLFHAVGKWKACIQRGQRAPAALPVFNVPSTNTVTMDRP